MVDIFEDKYNSLVSDALRELRTYTDINQLAPGSKARTLLEIINRELGSAYTTFQNEHLQTFVRYATGQNLELIGELLGLTKNQATRNEITEADNIQKFYVSNNGNFGSINEINGVPTSFTIPAGTEVYTKSRSAGEQLIVYRLVDDVVCNAVATVAYGAVRAVEYGVNSNVGPGSLVLHDYELYADYLNNSLKTTNIESIATATDSETNESYRYRIINQTLASEAANATAIRMACLTTPGVADVLLDEFSQGIGSGRAYIKGVTPVVSEAVIAATQLNVTKVRAFGNSIEAKAPNTVGVEMVLGLNLFKRMTAVEEADLVNRTRDTLYQYINSLDINEALDVDMIIRKVLSVDSNIKSIGTPLRPIENLYVWKYSAAEDNRVRREALSGYVAKNFERIIVEYTIMMDGVDPIRVRVLS
jgi:hypothetical protein